MQNIKKYLPAILGLIVIGLIIWRLPINGWGSIIWLVGTAMMVVIRRPHERVNASNKATKSRQDLIENILLGGVFLGGLILPVIHLCFGVFSELNYSLPTTVNIVASLIFAFGLWLFWRSHVHLGKNWNVSLQVREGHNLTTQGVYKRLRHPMYTAIFIIYAVQIFLIHNWLVGFSGLLSFALLYAVRVPREELMMYEEFGEDYKQFCSTRGRIIPKRS